MEFSSIALFLDSELCYIGFYLKIRVEWVIDVQTLREWLRESWLLQVFGIECVEKWVDDDCLSEKLRGWYTAKSRGVLITYFEELVGWLQWIV